MDNNKTVKEKESELCYIIVGRYMKGVGYAIIDRAKGIKNLLMDAFIRVTI
jgi:hypothetical protein